MTAPTTTLFRPIGQTEMDLIQASGWKAFPPRLFHQPIFYPVLTEDYAIGIARDWNTRDAASGFVGYVTGGATTQLSPDSKTHRTEQKPKT